jgi:nitroimidazol reductase NimA-like FMN-containing flavoprotein (pyridoxamine 5'-phosphate oxidase superfamily)
MTAIAGSSLEALPESEALALLNSSDVVRVIFTDKALPSVRPVTAGLWGTTLYFRTTADGRLAAAADGSVLTVEADEVDSHTRTGWSVIATGIASLVHDPQELAVIRTLVEPWAPGRHSVAVRVPLRVITGRRITV